MKKLFNIFNAIYKNTKSIFIIWMLIATPFISAFAADANPNQSTWEAMMEKLKAANLGDILLNIQTNIPTLIQFVVAAGYVLGVSFIFSAIHELRIYGQPRMMMPALASVSGPLAKMAIGALLIYLPGTLDTVIYTFWGYGSSSVLLSWDSTPNHPGSSTSTNIPLAILNAAAALIRLFGYIALINGFVVLSRVTKQGAPPGQWGKGIMHIIGGVLAINIIETVNVIWSTLFG